MVALILHASALALFAVAAKSAFAHSPDSELARVWLAGLSSPDAEVRLRTLRMTQRPIGADDQIVPALVPFLTSDDAVERAVSAWALGAFTPTSLSVLFEALDHPDVEVRNAAAEGIERSIRPRECWREMPSTRFKQPRNGRMGSYERLRSEGLRVLAGALSNASEHVRVLAAMTLWKLDRDADPVRGDLERAEADPSVAVRFWARVANRRSRIRVDPKTQEVIDYCIARLDDEWDPGGDGARELVEFGPVAIPSLIAFFSGGRFSIGDPTHGRDVWVFERLGEDGIAVLAIGLEHWYPWARAWSAHALLRRGAAAVPAMPAIVSSWRNERHAPWHNFARPFWDERHPTAHYLALKDTVPLPHANTAWHVAGLGTGMLPFVIDALDDRHAIVRMRAAHALELMDATAVVSLDALSERLDDPEAAVRDAAARAVIHIAPSGSALSLRALDVLRSGAPK